MKNNHKIIEPQTLKYSNSALVIAKGSALLLKACIVLFGLNGCVTTTNLEQRNSTTQYYNCSNPTGCLAVEGLSAKDVISATQYPIVLVHGLAGFNNLFGLIDYFNGIPEALTAGGSQVFVTKTSSIHNAEFRGEQLIRQIESIKALTNSNKVNLIGHSLGGIDIRYVAATRPDLVASVTAVASPEQGSKMADWVFTTITQSSAKSGYPEGEFNKRSQAVIAFFQLFGGFLDDASGIAKDARQDQNAYKAVVGLTTDYMNDYFNHKYPAGVPKIYCGQPPVNYVINTIPYYSFSGVGTLTNRLDSSDYLLSLTANSFDTGDANDGLVSACSSRLGYVIRDDYHMNHLDTVNQVLGLVAKDETSPITLYRNQANRLKEQGL